MDIYSMQGAGEFERQGWNSRLSALARQDRRLAMDVGMSDVMPGQGGLRGAAAVQASVGRLAGFSSKNQSGFHNLAIGTGGIPAYHQHTYGEMGPVLTEALSAPLQSQHKAGFTNSQDADVADPASFLPELARFPTTSSTQPHLSGALPSASMAHHMLALDAQAGHLTSSSTHTPLSAAQASQPRGPSQNSSHELATISHQRQHGMQGGVPGPMAADHSMLIAGERERERARERESERAKERESERAREGGREREREKEREEREREEGRKKKESALMGLVQSIEWGLY